MRTGLAIGLFVVITGCAQDEVRPDPEPPLGRVDLRAAMQATGDISPVGIAIAPDGQRFVFEETAGLYRLDGDVAVAVVPMSAMPDPGPTAPIKLPFTDLVAIGPNTFAMTAIGDGYVLDTTAMTLEQRFCYLPDETPRSLTQRTDGIAYDAASGKLYAQPNTYDAAGVFQYAQVAGYVLATGEDVEWHTAGTDVAATGMISIPDVGLVLGQGSRLTRFDRFGGTSELLDDLERFGVRSIDGLAIDAAAGTLVVVDKETDTVFDIDLARITL
ncbi:MAG: hypothetical protein H0T42_20735 [Deltaproteobacteria bacterium]|nr:hypothetical protein [Deltaproteobacteria bacterium]